MPIRVRPPARPGRTLGEEGVHALRGNRRSDSTSGSVASSSATVRLAASAKLPSWSSAASAAPVRPPFGRASSARAASASGATTSPTRPMRCASSASTSRAVRMISLTRAAPTSAERRARLAIERQLPSVLAIGKPKRAPCGGDAQVAAGGDRGAAAGAGAGDGGDGRHAAGFERGQHRGRSGLFVADRVGGGVSKARNWPMSVPAAKALLAGAGDDERAQSSRPRSMRSIAATRPSYMAQVRALRCAGRLNVMRPIPSVAFQRSSFVNCVCLPVDQVASLLSGWTARKSSQVATGPGKPRDQIGRTRPPSSKTQPTMSPVAGADRSFQVMTPKVPSSSSPSCSGKSRTTTTRCPALGRRVKPNR